MYIIRIEGQIKTSRGTLNRCVVDHPLWGYPGINATTGMASFPALDEYKKLFRKLACFFGNCQLSNARAGQNVFFVPKSNERAKTDKENIVT